MLPPALARWVTAEFEGVEAFSFEYLGYVNPGEGTDDRDVAIDARAVGAVILTKDSDFAEEARRRGAPPVIHVRTPNATNDTMRNVLLAELPGALASVRTGRALVEIGA